MSGKSRWPTLINRISLASHRVPRTKAMPAGGAIYLYILSRELALTCFSVTLLLWLVALRYGAFTRKAQRAYQDGLAETNEVATQCNVN